MSSQERPLRIVHVAGSAQWAGGEVFLHQMAERLDRSRFEMRLICPEEGPLRGEMAKRGVPCEVVPMTRLGDPRPVFALRRILRRWEADVAQSHGARSNFYTRLAVGGLIPLVSTVHGALSAYPVPPWRKKLYEWMDAVTSSRADRVVCVAEALRQEVIRRIPQLSSRTMVIHNGVDLERFDPARYDREKTRVALTLGDVWTLGIVGRLTHEKGHIYLLEALARSRGTLPPYQLLIVGDGPLQSVLEEKAHELNLMGSCRFLGVRRDIPEILSALDVLIMPSVSEGLPYVLLEALAMGLPVVASLVNGVEEIIPDGEGGGYTIPSRSPERIVDALMAIHQVPDEAKRRAERGRRRVRQVFDASVSVRRWQDLYLQLRMDMSLQGGHRPTKQCLYP